MITFLLTILHQLAISQLTILTTSDGENLLILHSFKLYCIHLVLAHAVSTGQFTCELDLRVRFFDIKHHSLQPEKVKERI